MKDQILKTSHYQYIVSETVYNYNTNCYCFVVGPTFAQSNSTKNVTEGHSITLDCSIQESNPPTKMSFTTTATTTTNVAFSIVPNIITISNAILGNSGVYTCTANNIVAITILRYTLNVES